MYRYFVSFSHAGGFGCMEVHRPKLIAGWADVQAVITDLKRAEPGARNITLLSFQRFDDGPAAGTQPL